MSSCRVNIVTRALQFPSCIRDGFLPVVMGCCCCDLPGGMLGRTTCARSSAIIALDGGGWRFAAWSGCCCCLVSSWRVGDDDLTAASAAVWCVVAWFHAVVMISVIIARLAVRCCGRQTSSQTHNKNTIPPSSVNPHRSTLMVPPIYEMTPDKSLGLTWDRVECKMVVVLGCRLSRSILLLGWATPVGRENGRDHGSVDRDVG